MEQGLVLENLDRWGGKSEPNVEGFVLRRPKNTLPFEGRQSKVRVKRKLT